MDLHVVHHSCILSAHHQVTNHPRIVRHLSRQLLAYLVEFVYLSQDSFQFLHLLRKVSHHWQVLQVLQVQGKNSLRIQFNSYFWNVATSAIQRYSRPSLIRTQQVWATLCLSVDYLKLYIGIAECQGAKKNFQQFTMELPTTLVWLQAAYFNWKIESQGLDDISS